jgi:hypothetical protein
MLFGSNFLSNLSVISYQFELHRYILNEYFPLSIIEHLYRKTGQLYDAHLNIYFPKHLYNNYLKLWHNIGKLLAYSNDRVPPGINYR